MMNQGSFEIISNGVVLTKNTNGSGMPMPGSTQEKVYKSDADAGAELTKIITEYRNQQSSAS